MRAELLPWVCSVYFSLAAICCGQLPPEKAHQQIVPADGLGVQLFAAEPQLYAPTAMDIDEQGRVWVVEGVNYRQAGGPRIKEPPYFPKPLRKTGDRIVVLEDTDGDGRCDTSRVFYEGLDINSPQGFAVFGDKVWISQSPSIRTIDIKPDGTAGAAKTLVTGFGAIHGDHSVHSVYLGPDRKLYGCFGNDHTVLSLPDGKKLDNWSSGAKGGVVFRMNLDATGLEVLADNFRNGYECATDSFGNTFYSDNDDDEGNLYCRFLYLMQGGNFGHQPQPPRGFDWNLERAGVVPFLMRTGGGAPAGLCVYEGHLLPAKYRGMPLLAEAGTGELLCFRLTPDGAGFRVAGAAVDENGRQTIDTLRQTRKPDVLLRSNDRWFRPSDVATAPDGSVFVADFYNHIAGGRKLDDKLRGRIYRLIPADHDGSYKQRHIPLGSDDALIAALSSPNLANRAAALLHIVKKDVPLLEKTVSTTADPRLRARALFALAAMGGDAGPFVAKSLSDDDPQVRVAAVRALALCGGITPDLLKPLTRDRSPQVRREGLLALRRLDADSAARKLIVELALQYDGYDRFYLEAGLLAMAGPHKETVRAALLEEIRGRRDRAAAGWLWALQPAEALRQFSHVASDAQAPLKERVVAAEWLGLFEQPHAGDVLLRLIDPAAAPELAKPAIRGLAANIEGRWKSLSAGPDLLVKLERWTEHPVTRADALRLAAALGTRPLNQWRLSPAHAAQPAEGFDKKFPPEEAASPDRAKDWADAKVAADGMVDLAAQRRPNINAVCYAVTLIDAAEAVETRLLCGSDDGLKIWLNGKLVHSNNVTRAAGRRQDSAKLQFRPGLNRLMVKVNQGTGGWGFVAEVEDPWGALTEVTAGEVAALADPQDRLDPGRLPSDAELLALRGDSSRGRGVFLRATTACAKCHSISGQGSKTNAMGPALDGIGKKMGRDALLESILRPDAKIAPQWITWTVIASDGKSHAGLIAEEKADSLTLVEASGKRTTIAKTQIEGRKQSDLSLMPQRLMGNLSRQELADLLQFLAEH